MTKPVGDMTGPELLDYVRTGMRHFGMPDDARVTQIEVPDVSVPLYVRTFTTEAWAALLRFAQINPTDGPGLYARLIAFGVCDAEGALVLTIEAAESLPSDLTLDLVPHVTRVNQLSPTECA